MIAEGIETALACMALWELPAWAAITAALMQDWRPPKGVTRVIVAGDCDENYVGQASAYALARRLSRDGIETDVRIPDAGDWADTLHSQRSNAA